jgi:hypothetical protein
MLMKRASRYITLQLVATSSDSADRRRSIIRVTLDCVYLSILLQVIYLFCYRLFLKRVVQTKLDIYVSLLV